MLYEIRFHGRGGQGAVTAATILVKAALYDGLTGQAIPYFGAERRGAPVVAFARISDKKVRIHSHIYNPDAIVILDEYVVELVDVTSGLKENGVIVINTRKGPEEVYERFKVGSKVAVVDATRIALSLDLIVAGWPVVNTAMLGAISKATNIVSIKAITKAIEESFTGEAGRINAKAAIEAHKETEVYEVSV